MSNMPKNMTTQWGLQPGGRGELFESDLPGFRNQGPRVNRTQMRLNTSEHDVLNTKYDLDRRLPVLFRYSYAYGYNQIVIPKGRVVAADPFVDQLDYEMHTQVNVLTLANGGAPVKIRDEQTKYPEVEGNNGIVSQDKSGAKAVGEGKLWEPLIGLDKAYTENTYKPFAEKGAKKQLEEDGYIIDPKTGYVIKGSVNEETGEVEVTEVFPNIRPGNTPLGIIQRNEYTRNDAAFNGMMPGAVLTDALVELPWFTFKDKAEENPWGSAYGNLFPGALVKSDENGRMVVSPLSFDEEIEEMDLLEYESERKQVIGTVVNVNQNLVPEGSAKYVTWALEDRLMFDEFNPWLYGGNLRDGEDIVNNSPYKPSGEYPGYPYDRTFGEHDLHMLDSSRRYSHRMPHEYQIENLGIPGLTDGKNVGKRVLEETIGRLHGAGENEEYRAQQFRLGEYDCEEMQLRLGEKGEFQNAVEGAKLEYEGKELVEVLYADEKQASLVLKVCAEKEGADEIFEELEDGLKVQAKYVKRGLAGVPTFMDWDGVAGSVHVLLQK